MDNFINASLLVFVVIYGILESKYQVVDKRFKSGKRQESVPLKRIFSALIISVILGGIMTVIDMFIPFL